MSEYRHKETGEVKSQGAWRSHYGNISLPRTWTFNTLEFLKLEPVYYKGAPEVGKYQTAERNGVEQDENGNWVYAWSAVDMFATDDEGTKEEKEAAYQATLDIQAAEDTRAMRNKFLSETDFYALTDVTMTEDMKLYRQALRDISDHEKFPYLTADDWPTKPA